MGLFGHNWSTEIFLHDLRRSLPWHDDDARAIYCSHTLEHLSVDAGRRLLAECYRVVAPDGVVRIVVPDLRRCVDRYLVGDLKAVDFVDSLGVSFETKGDSWPKRLLTPYISFPHRCMYDEETLTATMREVGFSTRVCEPFEGFMEGITEIESEDRARGSVIVEGRKAP